MPGNGPGRWNSGVSGAGFHAGTPWRGAFRPCRQIAGERSRGRFRQATRRCRRSGKSEQATGNGMTLGIRYTALVQNPLQGRRAPATCPGLEVPSPADQRRVVNRTPGPGVEPLQRAEIGAGRVGR